MRPFCEVSSSAKTLSPEKSVKRAIEHLFKYRSKPFLYEVRVYEPDFSFYTVYCYDESREGAKVAKAFAELETGKPVGITYAQLTRKVIKGKSASVYGKSLAMKALFPGYKGG